MSAMASHEDLLLVWFGEPGGPPLAASKRWFAKDEAFDRALRDQFEATLEAGVRGELDTWRSTPRGRLALIVLFDQLSRNFFRGSPRSFAQDPLALEVALEVLASGEDHALTPLERYFVLMPLMHAEDVALQRRSVAQFEALLAETTGETKDLMTVAVDYAKRHAAIVERFGRFPHRNAILGRTSTLEEVEFLKQPGSSF
jgi:uncharacterized protein (DUF924 family)